MTTASELPLRLTWDGRRVGAGSSSLALGFLPGRTLVHGLSRRGADPGGAGLTSRWIAAPRRLAPDCWLVPLSAEEHRGGELLLDVSYTCSSPMVSGLRLMQPGQQHAARSELGSGIIARTNARCQNGQSLGPELKQVFDWFSRFELRSNDALLDAGGGERLDHDPKEMVALISTCRGELMKRLRSRAEHVLLRGLLPGFCGSPDFVGMVKGALAPATVAGVGTVEGVTNAAETAASMALASIDWNGRMRNLAAAVPFGVRLRPTPGLEAQRRLLAVRDRILDMTDLTWREVDPLELGRRFRLFARGRLRLDDELHELNAEPDSSFFFLFAELAIALAELPEAAEVEGDAPALADGERLRWRRIARELVVCEHLFRRAYVPGPSLLVHGFDAFSRANMDRDPRRRTTATELAALDGVYAALNLEHPEAAVREQHWRTIVDDHALLVALACPGWLGPWAGLSRRLDAALRHVTVAADGLRGADHTVRLFTRHLISGFAALPHDTLDGQVPLAELGVEGDTLVRLADSLRGYIKHRSHGTQDLEPAELVGATVGEVLRLVVGRCRLLPAEGGGPPDGPDATRESEGEAPA